jgi:hypothetical protein
VEQLLHPKRALPAECFAYIGDANRPATWKLPYTRRRSTASGLPKAIQSILANYRGARVTSVLKSPRGQAVGKANHNY